MDYWRQARRQVRMRGEGELTCVCVCACLYLAGRCAEVCKCWTCPLATLFLINAMRVHRVHVGCGKRLSYPEPFMC
ncbi:hypothetical protein B0O80DRAFT_436523 [Mortierella sp. GBAus27b]|nr:hypothetical protein B0O80DRAFT_436523 [Mortierella sp. GBAus27b]